MRIGGYLRNIIKRLIRPILPNFRISFQMHDTASANSFSAHERTTNFISD
jgi:hypothetical protein